MESNKELWETRKKISKQGILTSKNKREFEHQLFSRFNLPFLFPLLLSFQLFL